MPPEHGGWSFVRMWAIEPATRPVGDPRDRVPGMDRRVTPSTPGRGEPVGRTAVVVHIEHDHRVGEPVGLRGAGPAALQHRGRPGPLPRGSGRGRQEPRPRGPRSGNDRGRWAGRAAATADPRREHEHVTLRGRTDVELASPRRPPTPRVRDAARRHRRRHARVVVVEDEATDAAAPAKPPRTPSCCGPSRPSLGTRGVVLRVVDDHVGIGEELRCRASGPPSRGRRHRREPRHAARDRRRTRRSRHRPRCGTRASARGG